MHTAEKSGYGPSIFVVYLVRNEGEDHPEDLRTAAEKRKKRIFQIQQKRHFPGNFVPPKISGKKQQNKSMNN